MRKQIAAANWKMNLSLEKAATLMTDLLASPIELSSNQEAVFGVPFPYLTNINQQIAGKKQFSLAAFNTHENFENWIIEYKLFLHSIRDGSAILF